MGKGNIRFRIDVVQALKDAGYSTYRIRQEKLFGQATLAEIKKASANPSCTDLKMSIDAIATMCGLLNCQPCDIIEYIEEKEKAVSSDVETNSSDVHN